MDQGINSKRRKTKGAVGRQRGRGELPKKGGRGRQSVVETEESQRREISGTEAKRQQNRDQKGPTQQRREGTRGSQRERQKQEPKGSRGGGPSVEIQIKGANGPRSEAVETLPEANPRGESVVSGETDSRSQSKGRKSISQGVTGS